MDLNKLQTEWLNPKSNNIDQLSSHDLCRVINNEDATVSEAVSKCIPVIAHAIDDLVPRVRNGGRVIYVGAGTSGRLGVLDASEIPPTFSAPHSQFVALIAGGDAAIRRAQEGAEDSTEAAVADMQSLQLSPERDSLIGIAASGRTPYVMGCISYAKQRGCTTIGIACCSPSRMSESGLVDYMITPVTGPEVVTGSTRMKAGTATKLVLNMLSTGIMIKAGKTFGNMMVDLNPSNEKLKQRSRNILRTLSSKAAQSSDVELDELLGRCKNSVKLALAVLHLGLSVEESLNRLKAAGGVLSKTLESSKRLSRNQMRSPSSRSSIVLCVDGGATKCSAVVTTQQGFFGQGNSGPCNVTKIDIDEAMETISKAIDKALQNLYGRTGVRIPSIQEADLKAVHIGLAGYDRPHLRSKIDSALSALLKVPPGNQLTISNDIDLLAFSVGISQKLKSAIVLVAGTGSVAMSYRIISSSLVRTGRSGGWGNLLGDDGSGFDLGRGAIRHTLAMLDQARSQTDSTEQPLLDATGELPRKVIEKFLPGQKLTAKSDLLSAIVGPQLVPFGEPLDNQARIAEVAKVVLDCYEEDGDARKIVSAGIDGLIRVVQPLLETESSQPVSSTLLVGGGLMQNERYRKLLLERLGDTGINFGAITVVDNPAYEVAHILRNNYLQDDRRLGSKI